MTTSSTFICKQFLESNNLGILGINQFIREIPKTFYENSKFGRSRIGE
jgi:hypothetical protein